MIKRINLDECDGCGLCIDVCPMDVLRMDEIIKNPVIRYPEDCMTCYNCERECPCSCIDVDPFRAPLPAIIA
jgi:NAD-dependent dihydropyrimidine dehydrogenase PreA subunit